MSVFLRLSHRAWILVLAGAVLFLAWATTVRVERVRHVTALGHESPPVDLASPTGYAGGKRQLIVPEHNNDSYQWIAQTQQMFATGEWRIHRTGADNAPHGRETHAASPTRWWLAAVAWCDHALSGRPLALAVEAAALWSDPLLHLLLLVGTTWSVARHFGNVAACFVAVALVGLFPFGGGFLPGVPDLNALLQVAVIASLLPLAVAWCAPVDATGAGAARERTANLRRHALAGAAAGFGLWLSVTTLVPLLLGLAVGALAAAWARRSQPRRPDTGAASLHAWRLWALAGAIVSAAGYLIEYFPDGMTHRLQVNHPLFALALLGLGEWLGRAVAWIEGGLAPRRPREIAALVIATAAVSALPIAISQDPTPSFLARSFSASRLSSLPNGTVAENTAAWFMRGGFGADLLATLLPLLLAIPVLWLIVVRRKATPPAASALLLLAGPLVAAIAAAWFQLRAWHAVDAVLLLLLGTTAAAFNTRGSRVVLVVVTGVALVPGLIRLVPSPSAIARNELTQLEVESLFERSLAHWLTDRAPADGAIVLAPPFRTTSLTFFGGIRGLGTLNWENRDGLAAAARMAGATTPDEARALMTGRGVTHIVVPSWDPYLDEYARLATSRPEESFIMALHRWAVPPWLQAVPYQLPLITGFEGQSVTILAVTDEQPPAVAISRLAEYFVETERMDLALSAAEAVRAYPADLGAKVALAQIDLGRADQAAFEQTLASIIATLASGSGRVLPWDRRVSLAIVLAQGKRYEQAKEQMQRCIKEANVARVRQLTTGTLYRFHVLAKAFELELADPQLRQTARDLLPPALRARLQ